MPAKKPNKKKKKRSRKKDKTEQKKAEEPKANGVTTSELQATSREQSNDVKEGQPQQETRAENGEASQGTEEKKKTRRRRGARRKKKNEGEGGKKPENTMGEEKGEGREQSEEGSKTGEDRGVQNGDGDNDEGTPGGSKEAASEVHENGVERKGETKPYKAEENGTQANSQTKPRNEEKATNESGAGEHVKHNSSSSNNYGQKKAAPESSAQKEDKGPWGLGGSKDDVYFYQLLPIYQEEVDFKLKYGLDCLLERLEQLNPLDVMTITPNRRNVCQLPVKRKILRAKRRMTKNGHNYASSPSDAPHHSSGAADPLGEGLQQSGEDGNESYEEPESPRTRMTTQPPPTSTETQQQQQQEEEEQADQATATTATTTLSDGSSSTGRENESHEKKREVESDSIRRSLLKTSDTDNNKTM